MNWIIWTCGWFLVTSISDYLVTITALARGEELKERSLSVAFIIFAIWIIGMIKFW